MTPHLENASLQLSIDPAAASWSLFSRIWDGALIGQARTRVAYQRGRIRTWGPASWKPAHISDVRTENALHGSLKSMAIDIGPDPDGLLIQLHFSLPAEHPFLLIQVSITNQGRAPVYIDEIELMRAGYPTTRRGYNNPEAVFWRGRPGSVYYQGQVQPSANPGPLAFFSNGWASWSRTGLYQVDDRTHRTRLGFLRTPVALNSGTPHSRRRGHFTSEMFGVLGDQVQRTGILAGFFSQQKHFGALEAWINTPHPSLRLWAQGDHARLDPDRMMTTDQACLAFIHLDSPEPIEPYFAAVARAHRLPERTLPPPVGWCSWYQYRDDISAESIRSNLETAQQLSADIPFDVFQIDDGFESRWGDWSDFQPTFPDGLTGLAQEIAAAGFTPGVWLAPFILHRRSRLAREHPDWLLRNRLGLPVNAGFQGDGLATALDLTHEAALAYAAETVHSAVHQWGFPYLKLDFLYAGALPGRHHDPTKTRAEALRMGLKRLREAAGETAYLVGCGCPLGSAIGLVDAMRISPDVAEFWKPRFRGVQFFFNREPDIPAAENSVINSLVRAPMHGHWWVNDPDCLLVRPDTELSLAEVQLLASLIALSGGSLILSDELSSLPPDRLALLKKLLPPIGKRPHVIDWFDRYTPTRLQVDLSGPAGDYQLIGLFNLGDLAADLDLSLGDYYLDPQKEYFAHSFWGQQLYRIAGRQTFSRVPAHSAIVLALRPAAAIGPQYLGSNLHISQGREITTWEPSPNRLNMKIERPGTNRGEVLVHLPGSIETVTLEGQSVDWTEVEPDVFRIHTQFTDKGLLDIRWKS